MDKWPILKNSPIIVSIFQLKFEQGDIEIKEFLKYESLLKKDFFGRTDGIEASINLNSTPIPIGISKVTTNTKLANYTFYSEDQKRKLTISNGAITYVDESGYTIWSDFKQKIDKYLDILSPTLKNCLINRVSVRFINQFIFDSFDDPTIYFKTLVASNDSSAFNYPIAKYAFKLVINISDEIYSILNQSLDKPLDKFIYIFDIDTLHRTNVIFNIATINDILDSLRTVKDDLFFNNVTEKIIEKCS